MAEKNERDRRRGVGQEANKIGEKQTEKKKNRHDKSQCFHEEIIGLFWRRAAFFIRVITARKKRAV